MSSKKYRKKPVEVEAMQMPTENNEDAVRAIAIWMVLNGYDGNLHDEPTFGWSPACFHIDEHGNELPLPEHHSNFLDIETLEGDLSAGLGDWVVKGIQGEFYPVKPDIFAATYEEVEETKVVREEQSEEWQQWGMNNE